MKNIMLVCGAGMSSSLLVTKMQKVAKERNDDVNIFALPLISAIKQIKEADCILVGPQIRYSINDLFKAMTENNTSIPCVVIDMKDYGTMNGQKVYERALSLMENSHQE